MNQKSLLTMRDLSKDEIMNILYEARCFNDSFKDWRISTKKTLLVANLFFEPSTRTHFSFKSAELSLGLSVSDFNPSTSSVIKGESLYDTVKTFESIGYDAVVIRHPEDEYFKQLENINIPILNAGDGCGNHPTQCLLDLLTIYNEFNTFENLNVVIVGDIFHSRVASSNREALLKLGSNVYFSGPEKWKRPGFPHIDFDEAIAFCDVVMMLRIQRERGAEMDDMTDDEYLKRYGLNKARYKKLKENAIILHPAPVNRGVEIDSSLVEAPKSRIFTQMENGVLIRKAVIKRAFGFESFKEEK